MQILFGRQMQTTSKSTTYQRKEQTNCHINSQLTASCPLTRSLSVCRSVCLYGTGFTTQSTGPSSELCPNNVQTISSIQWVLIIAAVVAAAVVVVVVVMVVVVASDAAAAIPVILFVKSCATADAAIRSANLDDKSKLFSFNIHCSDESI